MVIPIVSATASTAHDARPVSRAEALNLLGNKLLLNAGQNGLPFPSASQSLISANSHISALTTLLTFITDIDSAPPWRDIEGSTEVGDLSGGGLGSALGCGQVPIQQTVDERTQCSLRVASVRLVQEEPWPGDRPVGEDLYQAPPSQRVVDKVVVEGVENAQPLKRGCGANFGRSVINGPRGDLEPAACPSSRTPSAAIFSLVVVALSK